jgi:integrase
LAAAGPNLKAMILLGANGALGNTDLALLPFSAVNLKTGWLTYPRRKTGIERRIPLWPETVKAIQAATEQRPVPADPAHKELVFIGPSGKSYLSGNGYRVAGVFVRALDTAKVKPKRGFYCIRHTFQTIGEGAHDLAAVRSLMGHAPPAGDMSSIYRERIDDSRLVAVTNHVRSWLFGKGKRK